MAHHCSHCLVQCMDFRFMKGIRSFCDENEMTGSCDLVSMAGAAKNIAAPASPSEAEFALKQIGLSVDLHGIKQLVLMNHLDCGAYGGSSAFGSREEELDRHVADLRKARDIVKAKHPELAVKLVVAKVDDGGNVSFEYFE